MLMIFLKFLKLFRKAEPDTTLTMEHIRAAKEVLERWPEDVGPQPVTPQTWERLVEALGEGLAGRYYMRLS